MYTYVFRCTDPLPLDEYFVVIQSHFKTRQTIGQVNQQLNDLAHQVAHIHSYCMNVFMYLCMCLVVSVSAEAPFGSIQGQEPHPAERPGRAFEGDVWEDSPMQ